MGTGDLVAENLFFGNGRFVNDGEMRKITYNEMRKITYKRKASESSGA